MLSIAFDAMTEPPAATAATNATASSDGVSREELLELVRAIKFAKPDASQSQVHREISQDLASKGKEYAVLRTVQLTDVKKVWKKAIQQQTPSSASTTTTSDDDKSSNADLIEKLKLQDQPPQLYTIGSNVAWVAQEYTAATLAERAARQQAEAEALARDYVHVFLDVPMDKSGSKPHQALINFQTPKPKAAAAASSSSGKKKGNRKKAAAAPAPTYDEQGREIVKIQRALPDPSPADEDTPKYPMVLYNESRTHMTFIHPDEDYDRILEWILKAGETGALGNAGGLKAYFYAKLTSTPNNGPDILSIDVTQLAPVPDW